ncbi:MAG TPA: hypothetical protein VGQ28_04305 [Thermoanaerobaculia bacterium]|jgi:hypothetical protein|nr:hypothetical protein [Thermoanaerobaculia bacterium]
MAEDDRSDRGLEIAEPETFLPAGRDGETTSLLLAVLERVRSVLDRERAAAPAFCAELLALPPEAALERIRQEPRFQTWGLCELLLAKSEELAAADSEAADLGGAAHFAALALAGAERLDPARHAAPVVEDLKARAWAAAGEARRRGGDLAAAEEALRAAAACLSHGTGDLLVEARLLEFEAAVRRVQRRYKEAAAVLKLAAARYRETGETERLERALAEREDILQAGMRSSS